MNGREPSPAELQEDLKELTQAVRESQQATIKRLDDLSTIFLPRELYEARHRAVLEAVARLEVEVKGIKDRAQRAFWTSLTSIVFPLLVLVIGAVILASGGLR